MISNPVAQLDLAGGAPPSTMDGFDARQNAIIAQAMKKYPFLQIKSFYGERLYDSARVTAGTALPLNEFPLFAVPIGSQQTELNGTTQYTKTRLDTNMTTARQLPAGQYAWITSIQARVLLTGQLDDTVQTGANLGLANAPGITTSAVAADSIVGVNLIQAVLESVVGTFQYNQTNFETGPLYLFPSRYGVSGVAGGFLFTSAAAGTAVAQNEALYNNGYGFVYTLPVVREIGSLYQFGFNLQPLNNFVPTRNFRIQIILEGLGAKAVTG